MLTLKPPFWLACAAKMVRRPTEPPSSFSKYSVWQRAQEEGREADSPFLVPFLDYRTQDSEPPMPITLVDQVLARIREAFSGMGQHSAAPTPAALSTVAKLTRMAGHFASEDERRDVFLDIMNVYLGGDGQLVVNKIGKYSTDGTLLVGGSEGMPIVILEVKNKVGLSVQCSCKSLCTDCFFFNPRAAHVPSHRSGSLGTQGPRAKITTGVTCWTGPTSQAPTRPCTTPPARACCWS